MAERKKQSVLNGALILMAATVVVKVIGLVFKIPLAGIIGTVGRGYFDTAYNIYTPIYAISMAGLPVAVSKLVSQNIAQNKFRDAQAIFKVAQKMFLITGLVGMAILFALSYPYTNYVIDKPEALLTILMISPSVLFCCLMSSYKGYYEGTRNMAPSGITQVIEALIKLVLGLAASKAILTWGLKQFYSNGIVFGKVALTVEDAYSIIFPYSAAGAIASVTAGSICGLIFLVIFSKVKGNVFLRTELINSPPPKNNKEIAKDLISFALPVAVSSITLNLTNLIDASSIQNRLAVAVEKNIDVIREMYSGALAGTLDSDVSTFLYGAYGLSLDFRNLIPMITAALGISAIPAISAMWALRETKKGSIKEINSTINSVIRVIMIIALPAGIGMAVFAEPILFLLYSGSEAELAISISAPMMRVFGIMTAFMAVSTPTTNMLQAIGRTDIPIKSLLIGATAKIVINFLLVGRPSINVNGAPIGTAAFYLIIVSINLISLLKLTSTRIDIKSVIIKPIVASAVSIGAAFGGYLLLTKVIFTNHNRINTLLAIGIAVILYIFATLLLKGINKEDVLMLPKGEKIAKTLEKYRLLG